MDNVTHTLAGLLVGEAITRFVPARRSALAPTRRRGLLVGLCVVASNLPDADLLYTTLAGGKLAYLSQHRGYTHTVVGALAATALLLLAVELWMRWRRVALTRGDQRDVLVAVGASLLLHLALDFTNSYGVHPFWPLADRWLYGDAVFIVEPLLWACAAPLVFLLRSVAARLLVGAVLLAALALSFGTQWVLAASGAMVGVLVLLLAWIGWKAGGRIALACAIGAWLAVTAVFFAAGGVAAQRVRAEFGQRYPKARLLDHVLTPMPANPLCWGVIAVSLEESDYALRRAVISTWPAVMPAGSCPDRTLDAETTAPMQRIAGAATDTALWLDEYRVRSAEFPSVVRAYCDAAVMMRFARAPWLALRGGARIIGDLRYDREPGLGFAEVELRGPSGTCTTAVPPWAAPRADLLR